MKLFGKILFFVFASIFVWELVIPDGFFSEKEDLVELSDDSEPEEDNEEEERDESEWDWHLESEVAISENLRLFKSDQSETRHMGEPSDGERVIFCPPPEELI